MIRNAVIAGAMIFAASAANAERVSLPMSSPEGTNSWEKSFIEICSLSLVDRNAAILKATEAGWIPRSGQIEALLAGVVAFESPDDWDQALLQLTESKYPHLDSNTCMLMRIGDVGEASDIFAFETIPGVEGKWYSMPDSSETGSLGGERGLYSFIREDGEIVAITIFHSPDRTLQYSMTVTQHLEPPV